MGIASTTTLPIQQKAGTNQFGNYLNMARGHQPHGVAGPVVSQPPKHPYGVAGPVVSQPPKHPQPPHGVAGPVVSQPPKHQPHHLVLEYLLIATTFAPFVVLDL